MNLESWNAALLTDVRARGKAGQRLYLYVDRDLLGRLSGLQPGEAVCDFSAAVRAEAGAEPFRRAAQAAVRWKTDGYPGDPPFVAHLAMTVLAVTEVPVGARHGIYRRQNELLGLPAEATPPPGYGEQVPVLWHVWNEWLGGPGSVYGRPSARTHPHWTLQGWARSQGLVRHTDRLRIEQFLADLGATYLGNPSVQDLQAWLAYRGAAGAELLERFRDEAARQILQDVLDDEADRWRREGPRTNQGGRRRGLLHYDDWTGTFSGAVELEETWVDVPLNLGDEQPYVPDEFDHFLIVSLDVPDPQLLRSGSEHAMTTTAVLLFGGENLYVMRDEPSVSGRLQCRSVPREMAVHVLAHQSRVGELTAALRHTGFDDAARPSAVEGWSWFDNVRILLDQTDLLGLLHLAVGGTSADERPALTGGLPIAGRTYLVGGEPDITVPPGPSGRVVLDGSALPLLPGQRQVCLADRCLDPGEHRVTIPAGTLSFRTVPHVREVAEPGGVAVPVTPAGDVFRFGEPVRSADTAVVLAGAALQGASAPEPIAVRRPARAECLVITADADILEVWPATPAWLRELDLLPASVDVLDAIRTTASPAVCFVVRDRNGRITQAVAIPAGTPQHPGSVPARPRPDAVPDLISQRWHWVGPADARVRQILARSLARGHAVGRSRSQAPPPPGSAPAARPDIWPERLAENPYDDVLTWLSEREDGSASNAAFAETWAWLCHRHGNGEQASSWRLALMTLMRLGHVERDYGRQRVAVAPAALVALPAAAGLFALAGARPARLVERLDDPDDLETAVAAAASCWTLHFRTPTDRRGRPTGPSAIFVELDHAERETIIKGLTQLGVTMYGQVAVRLLAMQPSLRQAVDTGQSLLLSPGRSPLLRTRTPRDGWQWTHRSTDSGAGLYCYRPRGRKVFAWRAAPDAPLVAVDAAVGEWLCRSSHGETSLLTYDPLARRLLVPGRVPLPALMSRALTLRTALPPYLVTAGRASVDGGTDYLAYDNVNERTARDVGRLLAQTLRINDGTTRVER